jgi:hypothetical protein
MIEGSGTGSITLTNGSGSGRPKNVRIRIDFLILSSRLVKTPNKRKVEIRNKIWIMNNEEEWTAGSLP